MTGIFVSFLISFGGITGTVYDRETKSPLVGAYVYIPELKVGTSTDERGVYKLKRIPPGEYNVFCSILGYKTEVKVKIRVYDGKYTELDFYLTPTVYKTRAVTVHPRYFAKEEIDAPGVHSLSFREAYYLPGTFADVQRAVQALPGVTGQDNLNTIVVRGGNPDENLIVVDNMEVPNLNFLPLLGSSGGGICMFDEWLMDELNFYYGIIPVRYGNKISSVLDIKLKPGNPTDHHFDIEPGIGGISSHISGPITHSTTYNLSGTLSDVAWLIRWLTEKSAEIKEAFKSTGIPQKVFLASLQGKLRLNRGKYIFDLVGLSGYNDVRINYLPKFSDTLEIVNKNLTANLGLNVYRLFQDGYFLFHLSHSGTKWDWKSRSIIENEVVNTNKSIDGDNRVKFELVSKKPLNFELGWELHRLDFNYRLWSTPDSVFHYRYGPDGRIISKELVDVRDESVQRGLVSYRTGMYASSKLTLKGFTINPGIRFDYFDYTKARSFSPRIQVSREITWSKWSGELVAGAAREFQSPSATILLTDTANKRLGFYYADILTGGVHLLPRSDLKLSLEAYIKNYHNYPVREAYTTPEPNDWSRVYLPLGKIKNRGVEVLLQKKFFANTFFNLAFAYMSSRKLDLRTRRWVPGDYDQRFVTGFLLGYKIRFREHRWYQKMKKSKIYRILKWIPVLNLFTAFIDDEVVYGIAVRYADGRPYTPMTYSMEYRRWLLDESTPMNSARLPDYFRVDLRFHTNGGVEKIFGKSYHTESFIEFINVTNHANVYAYYWDNRGARRIKISQLPFMVNFGVRMRF